MPPPSPPPAGVCPAGLYSRQNFSLVFSYISSSLIRCLDVLEDHTSSLFIITKFSLHNILEIFNVH